MNRKTISHRFNKFFTSFYFHFFNIVLVCYVSYRYGDHFIKKMVLIVFFLTITIGFVLFLLNRPVKKLPLEKAFMGQNKTDELWQS
jgi:hypothetical protein